MPPALTRRRDRTRDEEHWLIFNGDVRIGAIGRAAGRPDAEPLWTWTCGFYPGTEPGECTGGDATSFRAARTAFLQAWTALLPKLSEKDFEVWRRDRDWHARKYAMWARGEKMPTQLPDSRMRCACGATFDSHKLKDNLIHCPHIQAAQAADGIRR